MVPVVVVGVVFWWWWGNVFFEDLNNVVAQSHSNNLGRSSKVRTTLQKMTPLCD